LETGQSSNHDNSDGQAVPKPLEANISVDSTHGTTKCLTRFAGGVELTDHDIRGMGDDGTQNTCKITTGKRHSRLGGLAIVALLARQTVIDTLHDGLKRCKFHHRVGDLATPKRIDTLVQTSPTLLSSHSTDAIKGTLVRVGHSSLHTNLDRFEGAQGNVSEELGRSRRSEVEPSLVLVRGFRSCKVGVGLFEVFVETVFEGALSRISKERRTPTGEDAPDPFSAEDLTPGLDITRIELRVDLSASLDQIKRCDSSMRETLRDKYLVYAVLAELM
jgi:hypothetical protein